MFYDLVSHLVITLRECFIGYTIGTLAGMIIGAVTVIVWKQFAWLGLYEIIPGFIFGSIGIVVFSLLGKAPSTAMQERFAEADAHYHTAPPVKLQPE